MAKLGGGVDELKVNWSKVLLTYFHKWGNWGSEKYVYELKNRDLNPDLIPKPDVHAEHFNISATSGSGTHSVPSSFVAFWYAW